MWYCVNSNDRAALITRARSADMRYRRRGLAERLVGVPLRIVEHIEARPIEVGSGRR
jgi:hypothetical protein